ncbi:MAG TPA: hypothetical protein VMZ53_28050 [Kofleriaceae bacterium]|nr:hypothetical protein [Kofleriaceae bacterium]
MKLDLARLGFVIENEWYWKITENAQTFDVASAIRDFVAPLARYAKDKLAITDIAADLAEVRFALKGEPVAIKVEVGLHDRVAVNHFVGDLNRELSRLHLAFALVVPRRYELRGVLLTEKELASLAGDQALLVPSARPSWRSIPTT